MRCPFCRIDNDRVVDSRSGEDGVTIRRRRECLACKRRFTTYERVEENPLRVIKKDGRRVPYEREKIRRGIEKACWNLNVSVEQIDHMVSTVESDAFEKYDREVPSSYLGELIMRELRKVNHVAYIRFASVYKEFKDVSEFMEVLEEFVKGRGALPAGVQNLMKVHAGHAPASTNESAAVTKDEVSRSRPKA
ncbi:MAG TPA: transcriptional regulator NrdR [Planctomycetota bacterium]|nr:transcriptional regulator NrdR [Planctomycetota bacterium]